MYAACRIFGALDESLWTNKCCYSPKVEIRQREKDQGRQDEVAHEFVQSGNLIWTDESHTSGQIPDQTEMSAIDVIFKQDQHKGNTAY